MRHHHPSPVGRRLAGLAGALVLAGFVVGGPVLLLKLGGNPLPSRVPTIDDLADRLTSPDNGELLLWALSVVGWVGWAIMASSIVLELVAQLTGRHTPRLPGLTGPQRLASLLVAATIAGLTGPTAAAHAAYVDAPPPVVQTVESAPGTPELVRAVAPQLRPGEWRPDLSQSAPAQVAPPAVQEAPPAAQDAPEQSVEDAPQRITHRVAEGDWMWHIAGRYLGDETRYPEIAALNPQYGEQYADYPDHIQPGDLLVLPEDARDRGPRPHATGEPLTSQPGTGGDVPAEERQAEQPEPPAAEAPQPAPDQPAPAAEEPAPPAEEPETAPEQAPADRGPQDNVDTDPGADEGVPPPGQAPGEQPGSGPAAEAPGGQPPQEAEVPPVEQPEPAAPGGEDEASQQEPAPVGADAGRPPAEEQPDDATADSVAADDPDATTGASAGPLAAAAVLAVLLVGGVLGYRRLRAANRRRGHMIATPATAAAEAGLRAAATADVARLDRALRALAAALADTGPDRLPDIGAVWLTDEDVHLILATPYEGEPPRPFVTEDGNTWTLPGDAALPDLRGVVSPLPALATVGTEPGRHLLVDLERVGMATITGAPERALDLLRYLVAELAHNTWSDLVEVTLVGFDPGEATQLVALNPARVRAATDLDEAVNALRRRLAHTGSALERHQLVDAMHGRVSDTATDTWIPQLLLIADPGPEHDRTLTDLERTLIAVGRRSAVAVVTTSRPDSPYGAFPLTVTEDGRLRAGFLDASQDLPAAALPGHLLGALSDLIRDAASGEDHPIPPAQESWARGADAAGGIVAEPTAPPAPRPGEPADWEEDDRSSGPALVTGRSTADPDDEPAPEPDELDELVRRWRSGDGGSPRVAVLGPIRITAAGPPPQRRRRACQELVVYLAARGESGASAVEISHSLWPHQDIPATVRNEVIASTRRWLGLRPDGQPWLHESDSAGRYRLDPDVLVDWYLFRRLRARGESRGVAGAEDLHTALGLVTGAPLHDAERPALAGIRPAYSWLPGTALQPELILAGITDTAHELVEMCLSTGDFDGARHAVGRAWLADPHRSDDQPWRDLLRIAYAEGNLEEVRTIIADLLRYRDAEHPDELSPATATLISELLPAPR